MPPQYAPANLIDLAIAYTKQQYEEFRDANLGIYTAITPKAFHGTQYLRLRNDLNRGCRMAVRHVPDKYKRQQAFSILMACLYDLFHYGHVEEVKATYNQTLREHGIIPP